MSPKMPMASRIPQMGSGCMSERRPSCRKGRWPDESNIWRAQAVPLRIPLTYSMLASKQGLLMSPRRGVTRGQKSKGSGGTVGGACARRPGMKKKSRLRLFVSFLCLLQPASLSLLVLSLLLLAALAPPAPWSPPPWAPPAGATQLYCSSLRLPQL